MTPFYGSGSIDPLMLSLVSNGHPSGLSTQNDPELNITVSSTNRLLDSLRLEGTSSIRPEFAVAVLPAQGSPWSTHYPGGAQHESDTRSRQCAQCGVEFQRQRDLLAHAKQMAHKPYACKCGQSFTRIDALSRHAKSKSDAVPEYPCQLCPKRGGVSGFRRLDNLVQHLVGHHNIDRQMLQTLPLITHPRLTSSEPQLPPSQRLQNQGFDDRLAQGRAHHAEFMGGVHRRMRLPLPAPGHTELNAVNLTTDNTLINYQEATQTQNPSRLSDPANGYVQLPLYPQQPSEAWDVDFPLDFDPTINPTDVYPFYDL